MAARKRAAIKTTGETRAKKSATQVVTEAAHSLAQSVGVSNTTDQDPRPEAWRRILIAHANGAQPPRELRVMMDDRFTGRDARTMVKAGEAYGKTIEESVDAVLSHLIAEAKAKGEKHTATL